MREPFNLRPWEIARLTDYQLAHVYFRPRDEDGNLIRESHRRPAVTATSAADQKTLFWHIWRVVHKATEERTQQEWKKFLEKNPGVANG